MENLWFIPYFLTIITCSKTNIILFKWNCSALPFFWIWQAK
jgi:hypothetical protein